MALDSPDLSVEGHLIALTDTCDHILTKHAGKWSPGERIFLLDLIAQLDELAHHVRFS